MTWGIIIKQKSPAKAAPYLSKEFDIFNKYLQYLSFFNEHKTTFPARSCVEVARLPKDVKIEIEAIAVRR